MNDTPDTPDTADTLDTPETPDTVDSSDSPDAADASDAPATKGSKTMPDTIVPIAMPPRISADDIAAEAAKIGCDAPALWAVCDVESSGGGFLPDGRPKILFEAHIFGRLTGHRFDESHPNISSPAWNRALYGPGGAHQHDRLDEASALDKTAALESTSWGLFQIMGFNFNKCGFTNVDDFVTAMRSGERAHLNAFLGFCEAGGLVAALASHDWVRFALRYNGADEAKNNYHNKLKQAYERRGGQG